MKLLYSSLFALAIITACGEQISTETKETLDATLLQGTWQVEKETFENHTLDCKSNPIKSKLDLEDNGYFLQYEDLGEVNNNASVSSIQTSIKGQYLLTSDTLIMSYSEGSAEIEERYKIATLESNQLTLENVTNHKLTYYSKK